MLPRNKMVKDQITMYDYYGFDQPAGPTMLNDSDMSMRLNFILEELLETARACGFDWDVDNTGDLPDLVIKKCHLQINPPEILDGLTDILVVVLGTCYRMGLLRENGYSSGAHTILEEAWDRIFATNMEKVPGTTKRGHSTDLTKPVGWKAPVLGDLVIGMTKQEEKESCTCQCCEQEYISDLIISDEDWERIKPKGKPVGGGLLCPECMMEKLAVISNGRTMVLSYEGDEEL